MQLCIPGSKSSNFVQTFVFCNFPLFFPSAKHKQHVAVRQQVQADFCTCAEDGGEGSDLAQAMPNCAKRLKPRFSHRCEKSAGQKKVQNAYKSGCRTWTPHTPLARRLTDPSNGKIFTDGGQVVHPKSVLQWPKSCQRQCASHPNRWSSW